MQTKLILDGTPVDAVAFVFAVPIEVDVTCFETLENAAKIGPANLVTQIP